MQLEWTLPQPSAPAIFMITSQLNWLTVLVLIFLLAFGCLIFISSLDTVVLNASINGKWILLSLFLGTVEIEGIISIILHSKKIIIKDKKLTIKYLFVPKKYSYNIV